MRGCGKHHSHSIAAGGRGLHGHRGHHKLHIGEGGYSHGVICHGHGWVLHMHPHSHVHGKHHGHGGGGCHGGRHHGYGSGETSCHHVKHRRHRKHRGHGMGHHHHQVFIVEETTPEINTPSTEAEVQPDALAVVSKFQQIQI